MKFVSDKLKHYWQSVKDFCVYKILHADDPPHRLALGIAIGMFVTFMPLIGFQMMLSVFLAWMLGGNKLVGVPLVWLSNPLTIIPIYYPCYWLGCKLLGVPVISDEWAQLKVNWATVKADPQVTWEDKVRFWWEGLAEFLGPLGLGCLIVASFVGVISYYGSLLAIRSYRIKRWGQLMPPGLTPEQVEQGRAADDSSVIHPTAKESGSASGESAA